MLKQLSLPRLLCHPTDVAFQSFQIYSISTWDFVVAGTNNEVKTIVLVALQVYHTVDERHTVRTSAPEVIIPDV